jgi:hypothetical protein
MNSFILAGALTFGQPVAEIYPDEDAPRYIAKAIYEEFDLGKTVSRIEKKYLKLDDYPELIYIGVIGRIVSERRVTYTWRF